MVPPEKRLHATLVASPLFAIAFFWVSFNPFALAKSLAYPLTHVDLLVRLDILPIYSLDLALHGRRIAWIRRLADFRHPFQLCAWEKPILAYCAKADRPILIDRGYVFVRRCFRSVRQQ